MEDRFSHPNYKVHGKSTANSPWITTVMNNIPRVTSHIPRFTVSTDSSGRKTLLRLETKSVACFTDLVSKFCKAGGLALDTYAGNVATGKAGLQLPEQRRPVQCEKNSAYFQDALRSLM